MALNEQIPKDDPIQSIRRTSLRVEVGLILAIALYFGLLATDFMTIGRHEPVREEPVEAIHPGTVTTEVEDIYVPPLWGVLPFVSLLLAIAVLPLLTFSKKWWHSNRNRFLVAASLAVITLIFYGTTHPGGVADHFTHGAVSAPGWDTVSTVLGNAILAEFIPFIVLLFSLYVISGGINLRGDLPARPEVNCVFIGLGALLASFIGTTGAAMVLIRPLLATNAERRYKVHTVIMFIFMACNCGGLLLPIGDPPLFLGYLRGVPFHWTLGLWAYWLGVNLTLLAIYYIWDRLVYSKEAIRAILRDEAVIRPMRLSGKLNLLLIFGVVFAVALVVPEESFLTTEFQPPHFLREIIMLFFVLASLRLTDPEVRLWNRFDYHAILEVAALFSGIFVCMQVPVEILNLRGASLGLNTPGQFFWATGLLSSFLDNAPTYVVFFETAVGMTPNTIPGVLQLAGGRAILEQYLVPVSLGAVFMGANTYIGNGPNFMVKSIAEQSGVKMPSFFGYMVYSLMILIPIFLVVSIIL